MDRSQTLDRGVAIGRRRRIESFFGQIRHLAAHQLLGTRSDRQNTDRFADVFCLAPRRDQFKRARNHRVARQDCGRFVEPDMRGRSSATQIVVVHRGQIVMHQRIGVD